MQAIKQVGDEHADFRLPSYSLAGLMMLTSEPAEAERLLGEAFATGKDPAEDKFVSTYLFTRLELSIAQGVTAELPVNRDAVGLALAELKQDHGDLAGAIDVVEQLEPTTYSAVSLAELYAQTGRWDDVIELTEGMKNEDDASALLCVFRGQAFREQGFHDAAHEALKEALRSRSRAAPIRHLALAERAQNYLAQGKKAWLARTSSGSSPRTPSYEGVREQLAELTQRVARCPPPSQRPTSPRKLLAPSSLGCSGGPNGIRQTLLGQLGIELGQIVGARLSKLGDACFGSEARLDTRELNVGDAVRARRSCLQ